MREKMDAVKIIVLFLAVCVAILFGEQIMEMITVAMMEQTESLVDQLLR